MTAERQIELQIDPKVLIGNECADALAKRGAELARLADNQEQSLTRSESMVWKVRRRLLAIQEYVLEHVGEAV